jgi:hypothetical protein
MKTRLFPAWRVSLLIVALCAIFVGCNKQILVLPIHATIDRHSITPGFMISIRNQGNTPMRWHVSVDRGGHVTHFATVVDGGQAFDQRGMVDGDTVTIESDGYETQVFTVR